MPVEPVVPAADTVDGHDRRTRDRVVHMLMERGPATAADLSAELGLTSAAVRRHLEVLAEEGAVHEAPPRPVRGATRGRGRPARVWALTDSGRATFPHAYDDLASAALAYLVQLGGTEAVREFAGSRVAVLEDRYGRALDELPPEDRPEALAVMLSADGYAASAERTAVGIQICQHHCPVAHVAAEFSQLCEAETEAFSRLLGSHVQRLATIAHGDGVCTTAVPRAAASRGTGPDLRYPPSSTGGAFA